MHSKTNQRKTDRLKFKNTIEYEEYINNEPQGISVVTDAFDISARGIGIYTNREFKLNSELKINCYISNTEKISFTASVVRIQLFKTEPTQYLIGTEIKNISEEDKGKLMLFLQEINIFSLLNDISLESVMDIHFMAGYPIILKRVKKLKTVGKILDEYTIKNLLLNLLDDISYARFMRFKDINFVLNYKEKRLRFNMYFQQGKIEAVCRIVKSIIPTPSQLGLPSVTESLIKNHTKGLIIIAGRTGAGKSTTLASLIGHLSKIISGVIISVEDPIEYIQERNQCIVKQRELGRDTISYASALRNALRQNPDVLIIGETLDAETMELVLMAAETGTLVITTFHSTSATLVMDRISSFFPLESQKRILTRLSLTLKGIIVQELFPNLNEEQSPALATEVFLVTETGKKIIREGDWKMIPDYILRGKTQGMQTMRESIENLVYKGIIDVGYSKEFLSSYDSQ